MREGQRGKRFLVVDDFLDVADLEQARQMLHRSGFTPVNSVISGGDGQAQRSRGVRFQSDLAAGASGRPRPYEAVAGAVRAHEDIFGSAGQAWDTIGFTFWKYSAGSRLGWHDDAGGGRRGEFILFLHEEWHPSWGGELMVLDEHPQDLDWEGLHALPGPDQVCEALLRAPSSPVAIIPKPNRLVMVVSETIHQISRVDPTATTERCTLTGFVSRQGRTERRVAVRQQLLASLAGGEAR